MWGKNTDLPRNILPALALVVMILVFGNVSLAQDTPGICPIGGYAMPACPASTDAVIRDQVISRISGSVASPKYPVIVSVCNGVVTISGQVQTAGKRDLASIFASGVRGVTCVRNELSIDVGVVDDLILTGEVRRALNKSAIDSKRIGVNVTDGVVELTGVTNNEVDRVNATGVVASVPGVTAVYNNITVYGDAGSPF